MGTAGASRVREETDWSWSLREGPSWSSLPLRRPESLADDGHTVNGWVGGSHAGRAPEHMSTRPSLGPSTQQVPSITCHVPGKSLVLGRQALPRHPAHVELRFMEAALCLFSRPSAWCWELCSGVRPAVRPLLPAAVSSAVSWAGYPSLSCGLLSACEMGEPLWGCWAHGRGACALRGALGAARRCRAPLPSRAHRLFCALTNGLPTP